MSPEQIVTLAVRARLRSIEWGGDVHVPHGNLRAARAVTRLCADSGLVISAYGSYYRAGVREMGNPTLPVVLETASALGAPRVRVWAGNCGSATAVGAVRRRVVVDLQALCVAAAKEHVVVGMEFHDRTLTDTPESALSLCRQVAADNLRCNWQPRVGATSAEGLADIATLRPHLGDVHVFQLSPDRSRRPLAEGVDVWRRYLGRIAEDAGAPRYASLEFVKDDDPAQLLADARVLYQLVAGSNEDVDAA
jgi:sugar phosphate isomerase/epimerase